MKNRIKCPVGAFSRGFHKMSLRTLRHFVEPRTPADNNSVVPRVLICILSMSWGALASRDLYEFKNLRNYLK